jgi:DNA polymerase-4
MPPREQWEVRRMRDEPTILHVDMDAFYAAVSLVDRPELKGKPVVVGAGPRSVVLSATYEARALGIHAAMPVSMARRLAPKAIFLEPEHERYSEVSEAVMEIFGSFTPLVEPLSLDEAFLDVEGARKLLGSPIEIATRIRDRIADEQRITCSVGIATTKFVAKLASGHCKPDGMLLVEKLATIPFLHPLPVSALWGVGAKTEEVLKRLALITVYDIAHTPVATLERALGKAQGKHLYELAWGRDDREVIPNEVEKSIGNEETFARDLEDPEVVLREILRLSERAGHRLRLRDLKGRTISIKVKFADFTQLTRSLTLNEATNITQEIYAISKSLYEGLNLDRARIRLVGVRIEGLITKDEATTQLILGAPDHGWSEAEGAVDKATARFGHGALRPARLVKPSE